MFPESRQGVRDAALVARAPPTGCAQPLTARTLLTKDTVFSNRQRRYYASL